MYKENQAGKLCLWRRSIPNGSKCGCFCKRLCGPAWRNITQKTERDAGKGWRRNDRYCGQNRIRIGRYEVISPYAGVCFTRTLSGHQIVADGNNGEENRNENGNGNDLPTAIVAATASGTKPECDQDNCRRSPGEIEKDFHSYALPYPISGFADSPLLFQNHCLIPRFCLYRRNGNVKECLDVCKEVPKMAAELQNGERKTYPFGIHFVYVSLACYRCKRFV